MYLMVQLGIVLLILYAIADVIIESGRKESSFDTITVDVAMIVIAGLILAATMKLA
jgi:hypothetical protein